VGFVGTLYITLTGENVSLQKLYLSYIKELHYMLLSEFSFGLYLPIMISVHVPWFVAHRDPKTALTLAWYT